MASVSKREWISPTGEVKSGYVCRYKEGGKHRSKGFRLKKEADAFRRWIEKELEEGTAMGPEARLTVRQVANYYIKSLEDRAKEETCGLTHVRSVKIATDKHLLPCLGKMVFADLKWSDVDNLHDTMRAKRLSPVSRRKYMKYFRQMEDMCIRRGNAMKPIFRTYIADMKTADSKPVRVLSVPEIGKLLGTVEVRPHGFRSQTHAMLRCFVHLAAFCGLRFGEIAALRPAGINLETRTLTVDQSLTALGEIKTPKTKAGTRQIAIPQHLVDLLADYGKSHHRPNDAGLFFTTTTGGRVQAAPFHYQSWRPLLERAGLVAGKEVPHFHSLRHFCASSWIALQMPLPEVAKRIGHSKVDMTLRVYAHAIGGDEIRRDFADAMSTMLVRSDTQELRIDT